MPRAPIVLTEDQVREVETLAALLNQDQIADYFGICRTTFRAICERDPEVGERYKRGKAKAIAHVANGLLQKARAGDTTSAIFYLKTQAGWREVSRHEIAAGGQESLAGLLERCAKAEHSVEHWRALETGASGTPPDRLPAPKRADDE